MSQGQDWNAPYQPPADQGYQPPAGQGYQGYQPSADQGFQGYQPPADQGFQPPPGQGGYPPAPYQQPYPMGYPGQPMMQVVPKNAGIALLISFFLPGVGSMYAGKTTTGVIILVGYVISWILTIVIIGFVGIFGFWVWGMIDAYQAAQAWNRARGIDS